MPRAEHLRQDLAVLGERRETARRELRETSTAIAKLARRAHKAGVSKSDIALLARISRPTLDRMLE